MSEDTHTCQIHQKYHSIICANPALSGDSQRLCILHSQDKEKDAAAFREAIQGRWDRDRKGAGYHDFRGVFFPSVFDPQDFFGSRKFNKAADFSQATFTKDADFSRATFTRAADFSGATFTEGAIFFGATFTKEVNFFGATFAKDADFSDVTFTELADFSGVTFIEDVDFPGATFTEDADFSQATFIEEVNFRGARIEGRVVFRSSNPWKKEREVEPLPLFRGDFTSLEISPGATLRFQDLSLSHVEFQGSDLRTVEFHHVQWHPYRGRQAIYNEVLLRQDEKKYPWFWTWLLYHVPYVDPPSSWTDKYGEVERLYRDLQENYEKARDYKKMGDFHYGEMEMHRRASKWRWFPLYWYNLYWALSGYGERPSRALGWLAAFLAIFTGLLAWAGLEILDPKHSAGFGDSFFYLLQKVTLQRPTWAEPVGFWGKLAAGFSVLLLPGQAALFILALRNRLGRRR